MKKPSPPKVRGTNRRIVPCQAEQETVVTMESSFS